jgi:hypothetical protein
MPMSKRVVSGLAAPLISAIACISAPLGVHAQAETPAAGAPKPTFEKRSYIHGLTLLDHSFPGQERGGKMQMMIKGDRRYLVQTAFGHPGGWIIDVSDPLNSVLVNAKAFPDGENFQVAWRNDLKKWICMVTLQKNELDTPGLRGVEFWDITDPEHTKLLSSWAVDGGDPARELQGGSGPHRSYYDGGRYAYLSTSPDNDSYLTQGLHKGYQNSLQIIDVSDITKPKLVSNWHMPGQVISEAAERAASAIYADPSAMTWIHGPVYVPKPIEAGGRYGYGSWGGLGMVINDLSDPAHPTMVANWVPPRVAGRGLAVHTIDVTRLNRGFVIVTPEEFGAGCDTPRMGSYVLDVHDPAKPVKLADLPFPIPPKEAPYTSFCGRYGRFGAHNAPHLKAPGEANPNFTCYSWFAAGLQCFDISDPRAPKIVSYFVPEQGADDGIRANGIRTVDDVFIEWDRRLIWISTDTGNYVLSAPQLGEPVLKPMAVKTWTLPGLNKGAP